MLNKVDSGKEDFHDARNKEMTHPRMGRTEEDPSATPRMKRMKNTLAKACHRTQTTRLVPTRQI